MRHALMTCAAGILCLSSSAPARATVYFQNTGVVSGWDIKTQRTGTVTQVTSPAYDGTVLRARIVYQSSDGNRYHAEAIKRGLAYNGQDRYYGQVIYLPSGYNDHTVVQQWATEGPEGPWLGMNADGGTLKWDAVRGPMTGGPAAAFATVPLARWFRVVTRLNMKTAGVLEVWVDGAKRLSQSGDWSTGYASGSSIRWSTGIYMSNWHRTPPTGARDVSVHHDHFRIASTLAEAEPASWGSAPEPTPTPEPTSTPGPTPTATPTPAPAGNVQLYQGCNYGGWVASFPAGSYTMADIVARGGVNDDASSIRIPSGYTVTLYQNSSFTGASLVLTGDDTCLTDNGFNDTISSLRIVKN